MAALPGIGYDGYKPPVEDMDTKTQSQLEDELFAALNDKDYDRAAQLADQGVDLEHTTISGMTPLCYFASEGRLEQAQWLRDRGADINTTDKQGQTALLQAILRSDDLATKWLLENGADPSIASATGNFPLMAASSNRKPVELVRLLLENGADPNQLSRFGTNCVLAGAANRRFADKLVPMMLDAGCNPAAVDDKGMGLLHLLAQTHPKVMQYLLEKHGSKLDVDAPARSGTTPLGNAAEAGSIESIKLLLEHGANPNTRSANSFGDRPTALMAIATTGNMEVLHLALDKGADVGMRDEEGRSVGYYALNGIHVQAEDESDFGALDAALMPLQLLLDHGLDPMAALDTDGTSMFLVAVTQPQPFRVPMIQRLGQMGFVVDSPRASTKKISAPEDLSSGKIRPTPLLIAVAEQDIDSARALLDLGANPCAVVADKRSALGLLGQVVQISKEDQAARQLGAQKVAKMSDEAKEDFKRQVEQADAEHEQSRARMLDLLLAYAPGGVQAAENSGVGILNTFIAGGHQDLARRMIGLGADPYKADGQGRTPLVQAIVSGNVELAHGLLARAPQDALKTLLLDIAYDSPEDSRQRLPFFKALHSLKEESWVADAVDFVDQDGNSPLLVAAATAQEDLSDMLLAMGADPNLADPAGNTPMHHALAQGKGDIVRMLRAAGGRPDIKNNAGYDATTVAQATKKPHLIRSVLDPIDSSLAGEWALDEALQARREAGRALAATLFDPVQPESAPPARMTLRA